MEDKVLAFTKNVKTYRELAKRSMIKGDYEKAFGFLFSALSICKNPYEIYGDLADAYSETEQFEKATEYWFKYIDRAPEDKVSIAYEELAVNFFYQDKIFEAGYYFHKKILTDGFVSIEGLGEEIAEVLNYSGFDKGAYHIAYPYDRADYSYEKKLAKRSFGLGDYNSATKLFDKIPSECMEADAFGEKAVAHFLQGDDEKTLESCRESIRVNGENLIVYCNLSTYYFSKHDDEKSAYYYNKALEYFEKTAEQSYQMASCAIEQRDHKTANECLSKIVAERRYDVIMRVYYGISYINLGEYERAEEEFSFALRLNPFDRVLSFYVDLAKSLRLGEEKAQSLLPVKYNKEYPDKVARKFKRLIKDLINERRELSILKKPENLDALYWGIYSNDETLNKECAILLWFAKNVRGDKILTSLLMDVELRSGVKRVIIYTLIIFGYREKFGVIAGNRFKKIKRAKLLCDKKKDGDVLVSAYATVLARVAFWEVDADEGIAEAINNLYENHLEEIERLALNAEEIAVIAICTCGAEELKNADEIAMVFGVKYSRIKDVINKVRGEGNA